MTAVSPLTVPSIPGAPVVEVAWQGGEPTLMGLPFFRRAVELIDRYLRPGQSAVHTIQTNGTKLDAEYGIEVAPGASPTSTANAREDEWSITSAGCRWAVNRDRSRQPPRSAVQPSPSDLAATSVTTPGMIAVITWGSATMSAPPAWLAMPAREHREAVRPQDRGPS